MARIVSLKFEHDGKENYCIVIIEKKSDLTRYTFRIRSDDLDRLLPEEESYFIEKDGRIEVSANSGDLKRSKLKLSIANAIADYFKAKCY